MKLKNRSLGHEKNDSVHRKCHVNNELDNNDSVIVGENHNNESKDKINKYSTPIKRSPNVNSSSKHPRKRKLHPDDDQTKESYNRIIEVLEDGGRGKRSRKPTDFYHASISPISKKEKQNNQELYQRCNSKKIIFDDTDKKIDTPLIEQPASLTANGEDSNSEGEIMCEHD